MAKDIIVVGASAGGIEALRVLTAALPAVLRASLFIVVHTSPDAPSMLADIFNRSGKLPATHLSAVGFCNISSLRTETLNNDVFDPCGSPAHMGEALPTGAAFRL